MNNKQKTIIIIVAVFIVTGFCYYITKKVNQNSNAIKAISKNLKKEKKHQKSEEEKDQNADVNQPFGQFVKNNQKLFKDPDVQIYRATVKKGSEARLRKVAEDIKDEKISVVPEDISDYIGTPIEATPANQNIRKDEIEPSQSSDQVHSQEGTSSIELASELEMNAKISSQYGKDSLHEDLRKLRSKMNEDDVEELIRNISFYSPHRPTGKLLETSFKSTLALMYFFQQIYKKHKHKSDRAEKYASILINNFEQLKNNSSSSITSNWTIPERDKTRKQLASDSSLLLL